MRRVIVLAALLSTAALSVVATGYQGQAGPQAKLPDVTKIKENLYVIEAASPIDRSMFTGGNTGIFITSTGVVVVDTKLPGYGPGILERIKSITSKPVSTIINTHTHGDHNGSNEESSRTRTRRPTWRRWMPSRATRRSSCRSAPTRTS
jgi:glyoxylase-like metal-dependent hydrolase (beta-lactamase superfamily II)